ncbi:MAG: radical SAM protein [Tissierellia bacterium]|nr:radical SAM protein [Tissierellia bacterium]
MKKIIPIFIPHFGCPHQCIFCDQRNISGHEYPIKGSDLKNEILKWRSYSKGVDDFELAFYGGSFTSLPKEIRLEFLKKGKECIKEGLISSMRCSTRPDSISKDILLECRSYGLSTIELGVQSMDSSVLSNAKRGHTPDDVIQSVRLIQDLGFTLGLQQMLGLPGSEESKELFTTDSIISLSPDFVRIYPTIILEHTELYQMYLDKVYRPLSLEEAVDLCGKCYKKYIKAKIPVIRMGLQASESLEQAEILIGPYHPSFGQMVKSKILIENYLLSLKDIPKGREYNIFYPKKDLQNLIGQKGYGKKKIENFLNGKVKFFPIEEDLPYIKIKKTKEN